MQQYWPKLCTQQYREYIHKFCSTCTALNVSGMLFPRHLAQVMHWTKTNGDKSPTCVLWTRSVCRLAAVYRRTTSSDIFSTSRGRRRVVSSNRPHRSLSYPYQHAYILSTGTAGLSIRWQSGKEIEPQCPTTTGTFSQDSLSIVCWRRPFLVSCTSTRDLPRRKDKRRIVSTSKERREQQVLLPDSFRVLLAVWPRLARGNRDSLGMTAFNLNAFFSWTSLFQLARFGLQLTHDLIDSHVPGTERLGI
jgi:hypothetical protein